MKKFNTEEENMLEEILEKKFCLEDVKAAIIALLEEVTEGNFNNAKNFLNMYLEKKKRMGL